MTVNRNRTVSLVNLVYLVVLLKRVLGGCTSKTGLCSGLLGGGTGLGSCAAPPFRSSQVQYSLGCPPHRPCSSEFGYCRLREDWDFGHFRDCNGVSNGARLAPETLAREARHRHFTGKPAGIIGPKLKLREQFDEVEVTDKKRPTTAAPTKEELTEVRRENRKFTLKNIDELKTLIYLMNKNYGVGSANNIGVTLKINKKLPSNLKTRKDFLEQLRLAILTGRRRMDLFY